MSCDGSNRDNGISIPTIYLDSMNETDTHLDGCASQNGSEWHCNDEQSFCTNVSQFFSWLSCFGSYRKFLIAIALLSRCEPSFGLSASMVFHQKSYSGLNGPDEQPSSSSDFDRIASLQWGSVSPEQLLHELHCLVSYLVTFGFQERRIRCARSLSVSVPVEKLGDFLEQSSESKIDPTDAASSNHPDTHFSTMSYLKKHYLRLFSELLCHFDAFACSMLTVSGEESTDGLRESVIQSSIGQLLIKTMLFAPFSSEDRNGLLGVLRARRDSLNSEPMLHSDQAPLLLSAPNRALSRLIDCVLEVTADLFSVVQVTSFGSENSASSLSHSLTSSGFLSGSGSSGSQCDLWSETANTNAHSMAGSHYGTLLTVPSSDCRFLSGNSAFGHQCCSSRSNGDVRMGQRQISDSSFAPTVVSTAVNASSNALNKSDDIGEPGSWCATTSASRFLVDHSLGSLLEHCVFSPLKSLSLARCSLPNALLSPVRTVAVQTSDPVSPSSASSTYSSSLELEPTCTLSDLNSPTSSHLTVYSPPLAPDKTTVAPHYTCSALSSTHTTHSDALGHPTVHNRNDGSPLSLAISTQNATRLNSQSSSSSYTDPNSGMAVVPAWLKSLRLHKYARLFESLTYDEFLNVSESWLENRNVTQGARTKLLLNIQKLATRESDLLQAENLLLQSPSTGTDSTAALRNCLTLVGNVLQTPLKPCPSSSHSCTNLSSCSVAHKRPEPYDFDPTAFPNSAWPRVDSSTSTVSKHVPYGNELCSSTASTPVCSSVATDHECLLSRIISCLTKVCSRLLITSQPDPDCCARFAGLLDMIATHSSFTDKHKNLTASWKQQMFSSQESFHYKSVPGTHCAMVKSWYKHQSSARFQYQRALKRPAATHKQTCEKTLAPPHCIHDEHCVPVGTTGVEVPKSSATFEMSVKDKIDFSTDSIHSGIQPFDDSVLRRHSVPVNRFCLYPVSMRPFQGRRMPSPNLRSVPSRVETDSSCLRVCTAIPGTTQVSDVDVFRLSTQFSRTRLPSPSGFDGRLGSFVRSNLAPPATAPPTRMPSPSDVHRQAAGFPSRFPTCSYSTCNHVTDPFGCSCSTVVLGSKDELRHRGITYPISCGTSPEPFSDTSAFLGRCFDARQQSLSLRSHDVHGCKVAVSSTVPSVVLSARESPLHMLCTSRFSSDSGSHDPAFVETTSQAMTNHSNPLLTVPMDCTHTFASSRGPSVYHVPMNPCPVNWPNVNNQQCVNQKSLTLSDDVSHKLCSGTEGNLEYIEHDLELLTRNVTELAIGDFDSSIN